MCPNHIEHDLASIRSDAKVSMTTAKRVQPATGRTYKIRRPKNASIVDIGLRRGFKNNGLIEIENDSSEEESEIEREYPPGVVFLVPEKGVKLDFIDRIKRSVDLYHTVTLSLIVRVGKTKSKLKLESSPASLPTIAVTINVHHLPLLPQILCVLPSTAKERTKTSSTSARSPNVKPR